MRYVDTHLHSSVSFDGVHSRAAMAEAAAQRGISLVCFTDHYDVVNEKPQLVPEYDWAPARTQHRQALQAVHGELELLYGLELGNAPADFSAAERALQEDGLDFVLGSIHNAGKALDWADYYYLTFTSHAMCHRYLDDYFSQIEALIQWGHFDSLAHIPYPLRYMAIRDGQPISLSQYEERIMEILRSLVRSGKALEINTNRSPHIVPEYAWLLRRFLDLGGEYVTVGSDAHRTDHASLGISHAFDLLRANGCRYVTVYRQRQPSLMVL